MIIGVLKEPDFENRVAIIPENVSAILKLNVKEILIEQSAGESAFFSDDESTMRAHLKHPTSDACNNKARLPLWIYEPNFLADTGHRKKVATKHFYALARAPVWTSRVTNDHAKRMKKLGICFAKMHILQSPSSSSRQKHHLNTYSTIISIALMTGVKSSMHIRRTRCMNTLKVGCHVLIQKAKKSMSI